jgi:hypothetical protein
MFFCFDYYIFALQLQHTFINLKTKKKWEKFFLFIVALMMDLSSMAGSYLIINNGGIIETRNGFLAPVGAHVDIGYGRIS